MKIFTILLVTLSMLSMLIIMPASTMAKEDLFLDAGFIQAKKQISALDFTLEDLEGQQVNFTDFRGKVVLLYFWTTW